MVETGGSTPAKAGAKMLVLPTGKTVGTVGGGALENRAIETAKELLSRGECLLQEYAFGPAAPGALWPAVSHWPVPGSNNSAYD